MTNQNTDNGRKASTYKSRANDDNPLHSLSPSPMEWIEDGVDHINIFRKGKTNLGKELEHGSSLPLKHSIFGKFQTIESFWYYIQSKERDDRVRQLTGMKLNQFAQQLTPLYVLNFRAIILDANYQRILQHDSLKDSFVSSVLPFDCYSTNKAGIRIRPSHFKWLTVGLEEIRCALKESRKPDFTIFKDNRDKDIYYYVTPIKPLKVESKNESMHSHDNDESHNESVSESINALRTNADISQERSDLHQKNRNQVKDRSYKPKY